MGCRTRAQSGAFLLSDESRKSRKAEKNKEKQLKHFRPGIHKRQLAKNEGRRKSLWVCGQAPWLLGLVDGGTIPGLVLPNQALSAAGCIWQDPAL